MSIDLCHGILTTVLTEQEQAGVESVVSVTAGLGGKTLLIVGRRSETPHPRTESRGPRNRHDGA